MVKNPKYLLICFVFLLCAPRANGDFRSVVTVTKTSDSILEMKFIFEQDRITNYRGIRISIFDESRILDSVFKPDTVDISVSRGVAFGIQMRSYVAVKRINMREEWFKKYLSMDSFFVVGYNSRSLDYLYPKGDCIATKANAHKGNYQAAHSSTACTVYMKNFLEVDKVDEIVAPGMHNPWLNAYNYRSLHYKAKARDSLHVQLVDLVQHEYGQMGSHFKDEFPNVPKWCSGFDYFKPYEIFCADKACKQTNDAYPPIGLPVNSRTGDFALTIESNGKSHSFSIPITLKVDRFCENEQGEFIKVYTNYETIFMVGRHSWLNKYQYREGDNGRLSTDQRTYYVCVGDTLKIPLKTTLVENLSLRHYELNHIIWDSSLLNGELIVDKRGYNRSGVLSWAPSKEDLGRMPHFTSIDVTSIDTTTGLLGPGKTNSYTFMIYVVEKQRSHVVLDSIACGMIVGHAEDTFDIPGEWNYQWTLLKGSEVYASDTGKAFEIQAPDSGEYVLEMVATPEFGDCPIVRRKDVYVPYFLKKSFVTPGVRCAEEEFDIEWISSTMNAFDTLLWKSNKARQSGLVFKGNHGQDTTVYFWAMDTQGCELADTFLVDFLSLPVIDLGKDTVLCPREKLTLHARGFLETRWNGVLGVDSLLVDRNEEVRCEVTDSNYCKDIDTIQVSVVASPLPSLNLAPPCLGDSQTLSFPEVDSMSFIGWFRGGDTLNEDLFLVADTSMVLEYGFTYSSAAKTCTFLQADTLNSRPLPVFDILAPDTLCYTSVPAGFETTSMEALKWEMDSVFAPLLAYKKGVLYYPFEHIATATNSYKCSYTDTAHIVVEIPDTIYYTFAEQLCPPLKPIEVPESSSLGFPLTYSSNGAGEFRNGAYHPNGSEHELDSLKIEMRGMMSSVCNSVGGEMKVAIGPLVKVEMPDFENLVCADYRLNEEAIALKDESLSWEVDGEVIGKDGKIDTTLGEGNYKVSLMVSSGWCADTSEVVLIVLDTPEVEVYITPKELFMADPVTLLEALSNENLSYTWYLSNGMQSEENPWRVAFQDTGLYKLHLVAQNEHGCTTQVFEEIRVWEKAMHHMPTAFTPDGNGLNDRFMPAIIGYDRYILEVYNRWGQLLFVEKGKGQGWDGMFQGKPAPEGVYIYSIKLIRSDGEVDQDSGSFALIRDKR